jgi:PAS domain S-box-containing protein
MPGNNHRAVIRNNSRAHDKIDMTTPADGIWIIDAQASTLYANSAMGEILGADPSALIGKPSFDYLFPEDVEAAQRLFESKQRGEAGPFRFRLRRKDGSPIWVDVQGTPMRNLAGEFIGIVGTFHGADDQTALPQAPQEKFLNA